MNKYKLKILSVYKIHWIKCSFVDFSTDGIIFKKYGKSKIYYLDGHNNFVLQAYEKLNDKWIKYYDWRTTYGITYGIDNKNEN